MISPIISCDMEKVRRRDAVIDSPRLAFSGRQKKMGDKNSE
jgi:hypothetical protein